MRNLVMRHPGQLEMRHPRVLGTGEPSQERKADVSHQLQRHEAVQKIRERRLTVTHAAELLHLSRSQVHRLLQAYDRDGANGLASGKRGRPNKRHHTDDSRNLVLDLVRANYTDFGPTLAVEMLEERHRVSISKEALRKWMTDAGLWTPRRERKRQLHQPRPARLRWRAGANRWFASLVVCESRPDVRPARLYRRRHGQTAASAFCRFGGHQSLRHAAEIGVELNMSHPRSPPLRRAVIATGTAEGH